MILTGNMIDAQQAERDGLVCKVVPKAEVCRSRRCASSHSPPQLLEVALQMGEKISSFSQPAVAMAKETVNAAYELSLPVRHLFCLLPLLTCLPHRRASVLREECSMLCSLRYRAFPPSLLLLLWHRFASDAMCLGGPEGRHERLHCQAPSGLEAPVDLPPSARPSPSSSTRRVRGGKMLHLNIFR
jgi:hypothetical protein